MAFRPISLASALLASAAMPGLGQAQSAQALQSAQVQTAPLADVDVVAGSPLLGSGLDRSLVPASVQVLSSQQIDRTQVPSLTGAILDNIPGATVNDASGNPFQPDIIYRGFTASPVSGTTEGLAVYVNGARFNEPFGDTVNWDLIPALAIDRTEVKASNPVFGLNALGGSVSVQMKNGFSFHGADITAYGGSYGRGAGFLEYGTQIGNFAAYVAGSVQQDEGWRKTSESLLYQFYTDLGWRNDVAELHLGITADSTSLGNPGSTPTDALNFDRTAIFTAPNTVYNKYLGINLNGSWALSDTTSVQGVAYYQNLSQRLINGDTAEIEPCDDNEDFICYDDGVPVTDRSGSRVRGFEDDFYSSNALQGTDSNAFGFSAQLTNETPVFGHKNHFVAGASLDAGDVLFSGQSVLGGISEDRFFVGPEVTQDAPDEGISPVRLATVTRYYGAYLSDVFSITPKLALNLAGRFNNAEIDLHDKLGTDLDGQHTYNRFNPSAGLTYKVTPSVEIYASYAEANRAPTPTELSCANPDKPCQLPNFFISDPDIKQVISRTVELGARGKLGNIAGGTLDWDADYYHTKNADDIIFVTSQSTGRGFFQNAGRSLRQGVEANLRYDTPRLHASIGYAFTDATFRSRLTLLSDLNPFSDEDGFEQVVPGDRLPGIPQHRANAIVSYKVTDRWTVGCNAVAQSGQYLFGDEANLNKKLAGYFTFDVNTSYRLTDHVTLFALVNNLFDAKYYTYGTFGPVGDVPWNDIPGGVNSPRDASPAAPVSAYGGLKMVF